MNILQVVILAVIQGLAELLPVSSSAHVIVAEKLLGLDPASPAMTFFLVMLHTGTMFAVLLYFWPNWKRLLTEKGPERNVFLKMIVVATAFTGVVGLGLKLVVEKVILGGHDKAEVEQLFGNLPLIAFALALVGVVIIFAGSREWREQKPSQNAGLGAACIGAVQGLCLPFRGFSRSGATISTGLIMGLPRRFSEELSFALAVVLTPPVILRELLRLRKFHRETGAPSLPAGALVPGIEGLVLSFLAGWLAVRWLSSWLESGKWKWFGYYCLVFAAVVFFFRNA